MQWRYRGEVRRGAASAFGGSAFGTAGIVISPVAIVVRWRAMWKRRLFLSGLIASVLLGCLGCGYHLVDWSSASYATLAVKPVDGSAPTSVVRSRMRDALITRCLAGSALRPVDSEADLALHSTMSQYRENIIATDTDGRTKSVQFTFVISFELRDRQGKVIWSMRNYQYSDQYEKTTSQGAYRDEVVFLQDKALRAVADLVVTNISLAIAEHDARESSESKSEGDGGGQAEAQPDRTEEER
ncbi:Lipopolysaccharide-assembly [Sulfidibacter corallicola]